jgi:hypothetical protein
MIILIFLTMGLLCGFKVVVLGSLWHWISK